MKDVYKIILNRNIIPENKLSNNKIALISEFDFLAFIFSIFLLVKHFNY